MKRMAKRTLVTLLALALLSGALLPGALASERRLTANGAARLTTYVGLKTQLTIRDKDSDRQDPGDYRWKSSRTSVAAVNSKGIVTAKSTGSTTITATNIYDARERFQIAVRVGRNRVAINISRPPASAVKYKKWDVFMKRLEAVSPTRVDVEYYLVCNYPGNWRVTRVKSLKDRIRAYTVSTGELFAIVVNGDASGVKGFAQRWGKSVQTITVTYTGGAVAFTNLKLSGYNYRYYPEGAVAHTVRQ